MPMRCCMFFVLLIIANCGGVAGNLNPVSPDHRSPHLEQVKPHLDFGGTMYAYLDIDGDVTELADKLDKIIDAARKFTPKGNEEEIDIPALFAALGFDNVDALGLSSYKDGEIYRNKAFLHHSGPRAGLMKLFGGAPHDFEIISRAPQDADFIYQTDLNLAAVWAVVEAILKQFEDATLGEFSTIIDTPLGDPTFTIRQVLESLNTQLMVILRINGEKYLSNPDGSVKFPHTELMLSFDNAELIHALITSLMGRGGLQIERDGPWVISKIALPLPGELSIYKPLLAFDTETNRLYLATSRSFIDECSADAESIGKTEMFERATQGLPQVGNSFSYVSPSLYEDILKFIEKSGDNPEQKADFSFIAGLLPQSTVGVASASVNLEDGIFFQSNHTDSHKSTLFAVSLFNPVTLGIIAAVTIPAFSNYMRRSKTEEAKTNLDLCMEGVIAYFEHRQKLPPPSKDWTPSSPPSDEKYPFTPGQWLTSPWAELQFSPIEDHYYQYRVVIEGNTVTCQAQGDLDGDGTLSFFEKTAELKNYMVIPRTELTERDPLE